MNYYIIEDLEIIDAGSEGKAVGKKDGLTVFVSFVVPGDIVDVEVFKKKHGYAEARVVKLKKSSPQRTVPPCIHFGLCGGCKWQNMIYEQQLFYKQKQVDDAFCHIGKFDYPALQPIIASQQRYYYRNKLEYTFSDLRWLDSEDMKQRDSGNLDIRGLGFHIPGKFDKVLDIQQCHLQTDPSNQIRLAIKQFATENQIPFYNIRNHEGVLRNLIIRNSSSGEWMVILVMTELSDKTRALLDYIDASFPQISSLQYVINTKLNDSITDQEIICYRGKSFITEKMESLTFKIGPVSFYQTNSEQAYQLYKVVKSFAAITPDDIVYDLYTGTGTIANFVAEQAKCVVGIEYVDSAIEDAIENSAYNNITNTRFFAGDMAKVFTAEFIQKEGKPDIIITDPPRAGMHTKVIERLLDIKAKRIVYVSCNPATQARDLTLLSPLYQISKIQPVDMFPHTQHVENVVLLELKK